MPRGDVHFGLEFIFQFFVFDGADNADDFTRDCLTIELDLLPHANRNALAERVFIRPETFGGGFMNNHHARMRYVVGVREIAARPQRNAPHREIAGRDLVSAGARTVYFRSPVIINAERTIAARAAERQGGTESGGLDAGNGAQLVECAAKEFGLPTVFSVSGAGQVDRAGHYIFRPEAGIDLQQFPETFEQ